MVSKFIFPQSFTMSSSMLIVITLFLSCLCTLAISRPEEHLGELKNVHFLLWTRSNAGNNEHYELHVGDSANLEASPFQPNLKTYLIIHGFASSAFAHWILQAKTDLLDLYDVNVIAVNWKFLAIAPLYPQAVKNVYKVGNLTGEFLDWLVVESGLTTSQVEAIGHSLGAHVAGIAGKTVTVGQLARITGTDPAGPLFHNVTSDERLHSTDAAFVDVTHTNGCDHLYEDCVGLPDAIGHVDFYVNGGRTQPGCLVINAGCHHDRANQLWVESIRSERPDSPTFNSWPCDSWEDFKNGLCQDCGQGCLDMGFHVDQELRGKYYLRTKSEYPFAMGDKQDLKQ